MKKTYLTQTKYLYDYQIRFLKNVINTDVIQPILDFGGVSAEARENKRAASKLIEEFCLYNFISEWLDYDPGCGEMYWDEKYGEIAFEFVDECAIIEALEDEGFDLTP